MISFRRIAMGVFAGAVLLGSMLLLSGCKPQPKYQYGMCGEFRSVLLPVSHHYAEIKGDQLLAITDLENL